MITLIGMGSGMPGQPDRTGRWLRCSGAGLHPWGKASAGASTRRGCTDNRQSPLQTRGDPCMSCRRAGYGHRCFVQRRHRFLLRCGKAAAPAAGYGILRRVLPGLSSVQLLAAAVGRPWQDWKLVSAHGRACDPVAEVLAHPQVFFLTGGERHPCHPLRRADRCRAGRPPTPLWAKTWHDRQKHPLWPCPGAGSAELCTAERTAIEREALPPRRTPGLPDEAFIRGAVPMTKQEVRAAALAKLAVAPTDNSMGRRRWHRQCERGAGTCRSCGHGYTPWSVTRKPVH